MIVLVCIIAGLLFLITRGGSSAFGAGCGTLMAVAFFVMFFLCGFGFLLLFALPFLLALAIPIGFVVLTLLIIAWFMQRVRK